MKWENSQRSIAVLAVLSLLTMEFVPVFNITKATDVGEVQMDDGKVHEDLGEGLEGLTQEDSNQEEYIEEKTKEDNNLEEDEEVKQEVHSEESTEIKEEVKVEGDAPETGNDGVEKEPLRQSMVMSTMSTTPKTLEPNEDFQYYTNGIDGGIKIGNYLSSYTDIIIPDTVNGVPVTEIHMEAFKDDGLTSVKIPSTVKVIGREAFRGNRLTSIDIPDGVETLEMRTFENNQLKFINLPNELKVIGLEVFKGNQLVNLEIPDKVVDIGESAFIGNSTLSSITLGKNVKTIGRTAFINASISNLTLPNGLVTIGWSAFENNQISSLDIPSSVEIVENSAFKNNKIEELILREGIKTLGVSAFNNNKIKSIDLPDSLETAGDSVFRGNEITSVDFGKGLKKLGTSMFMSNKLKHIEIPSHIKELPSQIFHTNELETVKLNTGLVTIGQNALRNNKLKAVDIPEGVTTIGNYAFSSNTLNKVKLPKSLVSIGDYAFSYNRLTGVVIPENVTSMSTYTFYANSGTSGKFYIAGKPGSYAESYATGRGYDFYEEVKEYDFTHLIGGAVEITEYLGSNTNVEIPETIYGRDVISIGEKSFQNKGINGIKLPNKLITIGTDALLGNNITRVEIPTSVTSIADGAFSSNRLTGVTLGSGIRTIGNTAFKNNTLVAKDFVVTGDRFTEAERVASYNGYTLKLIDVNPPVIKLTKNGGEGYTNNPETTIHVTDASTGITKVEYIWTSNKTVPTSGFIVENVTVKAGDTLAIDTELTPDKWYTAYLHVRATDKNGNVGTYVSGEFKIDNTPPTVEVENGDEVTWTNKMGTRVWFEDDKSGIQMANAIWSKNKGGLQVEDLYNAVVIESGDYVLSNVDAQEQYLYLIVVDNASNPTIYESQPYKLDTEKPTGEVSISKDGMTTEAVTLTITAQDALSGVKRVKTPDGKWVSGNKATYTVESNGVYTFTIEDIAGNTQEVIKTVSNIDKEAPKLNINGNPTDWEDEDSITLYVNATDNISGVKSITLPDKKVVTGNIASYEVNANGEYTFIVTDNVGNTTTQTVKVDKLMVPYTFYMYDSNGKPVKGAGFDLLRDGIKYSEAVSDDTGLVNFGKVPPTGKYTIKQTKAPDGYVVNPDEKEVDVGDTTEPEEFISYPRGKELPGTGTLDNSIMVGLSSLTLLAYLYITKKKQQVK